MSHSQRCMALCIVATVSAVVACRPSTRQLAEKLADSTLTVQTFDALEKPLGTGTAFFIAPDAVLTNIHVLKWAKTLTLSSPKRGVSFKVKSVVGVNFDRDLCVIRVSSTEGRPLQFAGKGSVAVGDKVFVAGTPKGLEGTISAGILSAVRDGGRLFQIDAPISPGSSGGPVVNERGEAIGIATMSLIQGQNLNFAVAVLGGPDVREVDWPVFDVGVTALSSLEKNFLKGPVKRMHERTFFGRKFPNPSARGRCYSQLETEFNEYGMTRRIGGGSEEPDRFTVIEYYDSRVMSGVREGQTLTHYSYDKGRSYAAGSGFGDTRKFATTLRTTDAFGRTSEERVSEGESTWQTTYQYDDRGLLLEELTRWDDGLTERITYSYLFDAYGNWIERRSSKEWERVEREIEYYSPSEARAPAP